MSRLPFSPVVAGYLEDHAVDPELAAELGVRSDRDDILYRYQRPRGGTFDRRRVLATGITKQPSGEPLTLYFPAGRPDPGADVLLAEGEPDALAALSALNGIPITVAALPGTSTPAERVTGELAAAGTVILAMDGDKAGRKAADRFARALQQFTNLKLIELGDGEDLASRLYREADRAGWLRSAIADAKDVPKLTLKAEPQGYNRRKGADATRELLANGIDPDKLDLGELLDAVRDFITDYVVLPAVTKGDKTYDRVVGDLLAAWVVHTWAFPACFATPYLRVVSAAPVSAKSLLLEVLSSISRRGWLAVNPSPAVLYRKIDRDQPSLFLDELDNFALDEKRDALAVLNSGYKPGVPVPRCNDKGELEEFACFCPKGYAGLDERQLVPALLSRSITIRMETKRPGDKVEMWIAPDVAPRAADLRARCEAWAARHTDELKDARPDLVGLINRQAEVWWILLALGELAGGEWTDRIREAARVLGAGGDETDQPSQQVQLLTDIRAAFGNERTISTKDLLAFLNGLDESPWGARRRGEGLDARGLARALRPFRIKPKKVRTGEDVHKGYHVDGFADAFDRYLPPSREGEHGATRGTSASQSQANVPHVPHVAPSEGAGDTPSVEERRARIREGAGEEALIGAAEAMVATGEATWADADDREPSLTLDYSGNGTARGCASHAAPVSSCRYCQKEVNRC